MQRILILGGEGMLGHKAYQVLSGDFETFASFLNFNGRLKATGVFDEQKIFDRIDAFDFNSLKRAMDACRPDFVVNCIGIIKQVKEAQNPKVSVYVNALLPHLLAEEAERRGAKLVHVSTDCVFSGRKGGYVEGDVSDAEDIYGRTKYLGEVGYGPALTLRTSIIGREMFTSLSLVDWFLSQRGKTVRGYVNAIYTGLTTEAFCREVGRVLRGRPGLSGLHHLSADKISKHRLLNLIRDIYGLDIEIIPYEDYRCDRSLDSTRYRKETDFVPPSWEKMIRDMRDDPTPYAKWREP